MNTSVTGCIVTHNNETKIRETLDSVLSRTKGVALKLYAVDNLSTDGTVDILRGKEKEYDNLEVIENRCNRGFGAGHNTVLKRLDSTYHLIINPDVILRQDAIADMAAYLDKNPDIGLLSPNVCFPDGSIQILGKRDPKIKYLAASRMRGERPPGRLLREYAMLDRDMSQPFDIENATGCFMMLRTELFKRIGGFDERYFMYFEDCDLTRTVRKTSRAVYYPGAVVYHVWGRESKKNFKLMLIQIKSMFAYFRKWRI
ncbi:MAG: glycosyltransferase family 2 protein [Oscillospiraceae bacterium]|nr:glycosyltransferase family 2 protein [Oscillospiraceae bacterium]